MAQAEGRLALVAADPEQVELELHEQRLAGDLLLRLHAEAALLDADRGLAVVAVDPLRGGDLGGPQGVVPVGVHPLEVLDEVDLGEAVDLEARRVLGLGRLSHAQAAGQRGRHQQSRPEPPVENSHRVAPYRAGPGDRRGGPAHLKPKLESAPGRTIRWGPDTTRGRLPGSLAHRDRRNGRTEGVRLGRLGPAAREYARWPRPSAHPTVGPNLEASP